jgi:hypothetical protein
MITHLPFVLKTLHKGAVLQKRDHIRQKPTREVKAAIGTVGEHVVTAY